MKIKKAINAVRIINTTEAISLKALELLERYSLSHKLDVPDAFIADINSYGYSDLYSKPKRF